MSQVNYMAQVLGSECFPRYFKAFYEVKRWGMAGLTPVGHPGQCYSMLLIIRNNIIYGLRVRI